MKFSVILLLASLVSADESLVGKWALEGKIDSLEIREDGILVRGIGIDIEEILDSAELGFSDTPDVDEALMNVLHNRSIHVLLRGTWEARGSRFVSVYETADAREWNDLVEEIMEVAGPAMRLRLEDKDEETINALIRAYRGLLASTFSVDETFKIGEEISVSWSIDNNLLTLGGDVYMMVIGTAVMPVVSWGELKNR